MGRQVLLLVASYVFYGWWDVRFLSLIVLSTTIDYVAARQIWTLQEAGAPKEKGRPWLVLSIVSNLTILGFFKYFNFFMDNAEPILRSMGMENNWLDLNIILPVGISFYTFQSMAYSIDVYRRATPACRNLLTFAVYVAFFPQLVAGPIERAGHLIPQLHKPRELDWRMFQSGIALIILGFFKKLVIADPIAPYVMMTVENPSAYTTSRLMLSAYLFTFQLYADFSGYSDIARGSARLFGVDLMRNFEQPFHSRSMGETWRRWHISLSRWFFDYLYVPLGGSKVAPAMVYFNLIVVMVLSGLWHGAGWNFIIWGFFHGLLVSGERAMALERKRRNLPPPPETYLRRTYEILRTWHLWVLSLLIFLSRDLTRMVEYFHGLITRWQFWFPDDTRALLWLAMVAAITYFIDKMQIRTGVHEFTVAMRPWAGGIILGLMVLGIIYWSDFPGVPFIYFQF
jgi:alginate O-acetyltransferase complex protein AlgI